jgi:hypothetical protein
VQRKQRKQRSKRTEHSFQVLGGVTQLLHNRRVQAPGTVVGLCGGHIPGVDAVVSSSADTNATAAERHLIEAPCAPTPRAVAGEWRARRPNKVAGRWRRPRWLRRVPTVRTICCGDVAPTIKDCTCGCASSHPSAPSTMLMPAPSHTAPTARSAACPTRLVIEARWEVKSAGIRW